MATTQGSKVLYSDVKNWYTVFNNLASNYSSGITTLTVPSSGAKIEDTHINNLVNQIAKFRNDYWLKTQKSWWPAGTKVTAGAKISVSDLTAITATVSNASKVKCKNTATNNNGSNTVACGSGTNSRTCTKCQNSVKSAAIGSLTHSSGNCQSGTVSCGTCTHGDHSSACGSGTVIDITCVKTTI